MAFAHPTDMILAKRFSDFLVPNTQVSGAPYTEMKLLLYRLDAAGVETLVFESNAFADDVAGKTLGFRDANDVGNLEAAVLDGRQYRLELREYDDADTPTSEQAIEEWFFSIFPDQIQTQISQSTTSTLDSAMLTKLLHALGYASVDLEFTAPNGYTTGRKRYGFDADDLSLQAALDLINEESTDVSAAEFKSAVILTTSDGGNEKSLREVEEPLT